MRYETDPDEGGLPDWVTRTGFIFAVVIIAVFGVPYAYHWVGRAAAPGPQLPCFDFSQGTWLTIERASVKGKEDVDRARVEDVRKQAVKFMEKCPYGDCEGENHWRLRQYLGYYFNSRREQTYLYRRDVGVSGVRFVNGLYTAEADRRIYAYLKKGFEKDKLAWLNPDGLASATIDPWLAAKGGDIGVCPTSG